VLSQQQIAVESIPLMEPSGWNGYINSATGSRSLLRVCGSKGAKLVTALAAAGLVLSPAFAANGTTQAKKRAPAVALSFDPISSFTPANGDPRLPRRLLTSRFR
jgi:hypothetical protein